MLRECLRVLRPGGVLRLATPDFARLVELYEGRAGPDGAPYLRWHHRNFSPAKPLHPLVVINHDVRAWGHTFLYDEEVLTNALTDAGSIDVGRHELGRSPPRSCGRSSSTVARLPTENAPCVGRLCASRGGGDPISRLDWSPAYDVPGPAGRFAAQARPRAVNAQHAGCERSRPPRSASCT